MTGSERPTGCVRDLALPALEQVRAYLARETNYEVALDEAEGRVELVVSDPEGDAFRYTVEGCREGPAGNSACPGLRVTSAGGSREFDCGHCSSDQLRDHCLDECRHWLLC